MAEIRSRLRLGYITRLAIVALGGAGLISSFVGSQGCDSSEVPVIDCNTVTAKKYGELTIWKTCTNCHSTDRKGDARHGATVGYDYNNPTVAKQTITEAQEDVAGLVNLMPPEDGDTIDGGGPPPIPTEEERMDFYAWVQCGQKE